MSTTTIGTWEVVKLSTGRVSKSGLTGKEASMLAASAGGGLTVRPMKTKTETVLEGKTPKFYPRTGGGLPRWS